jgi:hypothetical protein
MLKAKIAEETGEKRVALEALYTLTTKIEEIEQEREEEIQKIMMKSYKKMEPFVKETGIVV